jgi:hypothetical protein
VKVGVRGAGEQARVVDRPAQQLADRIVSSWSRSRSQAKRWEAFPGGRRSRPLNNGAQGRHRDPESADR